MTSGVVGFLAVCGVLSIALIGIAVHEAFAIRRDRSMGQVWWAKP